METTLKLQSFSPATQMSQKPKRLSKAGQWRKDNPGGIIVVLDRRAVNK